ncbi:Lipid II flippase FtsW [Desulfamplus magnetovallimortis]|uniref:Probable peptidoglycan glycosyltransferase FtsW n=1 Tax=Desulfamplus magnetovallimortis TaxID=1246637 RepID=A0A1W1HDY5_9BACT|nr:putative lipid II flippase FtsW [Desulfamplus magnetovallimortis]SLM30689.1 Lipid II flippase FtsW [Desulfamplus magnetovallimortis]
MAQNKTKKDIHPFLNELAILFPVAILAGLGLIMIHSASASISFSEHGTAFHYVQKQLVFCALGFLVMFIAASVPYKILNPLAYIILVSAFIFLAAVKIPGLGVKAGGAYRWLKLGGMSFQPSEFTKLAMVIFLAYSLNKKQEQIHRFFVGFFPHLILLGLLSLLILSQPDLGSVVILGAITWGMMFVAGVRLLHLASLIPIIIPLVYFQVYKIPYRMERLFAYLYAWDDPQDTGYQITHSLKAFGSGGLFGKGIGLGMQKLHYLPEPHTDFILSIIGEELGLFGVLIILVLYGIILMRGARIAKEADTLFGTLTAAGLTIALALQVTINTGVTMGLLPTKGLTLPFLSYGGTSLLISMAGMGILMNIGSHKKS